MSSINLLTRRTTSSKNSHIQERQHQILIHLSQQCQVEVAVPTPKSASRSLQSVLSQSCEVEIAWVIGIWKCLLECQDWGLAMLLFANCNHYILWHAFFGEAFIVIGGNLAEHIIVKCPPKMAFFDGQNGIWQVLKTSILNTCPKYTPQCWSWHLRHVSLYNGWLLWLHTNIWVVYNKACCDKQTPKKTHVTMRLDYVFQI